MLQCLQARDEVERTFLDDGALDGLIVYGKIEVFPDERDLIGAELKPHPRSHAPLERVQKLSRRATDVENAHVLSQDRLQLVDDGSLVWAVHIEHGFRD